MFYDYVKNQWLKGNVSVGLSAGGDDRNVQLESSGLTALALLFLSANERAMIVELAKEDANNAKVQAEEPGYTVVRGEHGYGPVPELVEAVKQACITHYAAYGPEGLYLIGSRAKERARELSDHDFVLVLSDDAPDHIVRDNGLHSHLGVSNIRKATAGIVPGAKSPDFVICRISDFNLRKNVASEGFPYVAEHEGIKII